MNLGRPTKYNHTVLDKTIDYINNYKKCGDVIPTIIGLSLQLGVSKKTIYNWSQKPENNELLHALGMLKYKQHSSLINNGLLGKFNTAITKLMLINNHEYYEKPNLNKQEDIVITVVREKTPIEMTDAELDDAIRKHS